MIYKKENRNGVGPHLIVNVLLGLSSRRKIAMDTTLVLILEKDSVLNLIKYNHYISFIILMVCIISYF